MGLRSTAIIFTLITLLVSSGCGSGTAQKLEAPKKAINTYLEGIKEKDKNKIFETVDSRVYMRFDESEDPELKKFFSNFDQTNGTIKNWTIEEKEIFFSELNGQAVMNVDVITARKFLKMEFDVRTDNGEKWHVFRISSAKE